MASDEVNSAGPLLQYFIIQIYAFRSSIGFEM